MEEIYREITPLKKDQLFFAKFTPNDPMVFPFHSHEDYELTLCLNVKGKRVVGSLVEEIEDTDLVLIGPDVLHGYKWDDNFEGSDVAVIQFSHESAAYQMFHRGVLHPIGEMLSKVNYGIRFSKKTTEVMKDKIVALSKAEGIESFHLFIDILYGLATSRDYVTLSAVSDMSSIIHCESKRVNAILKYIDDNYMNRITLEQLGHLVRMSPSAVCRYFKQKTKMNLWEYINSYRIDKVALLMLKTDDYISEICYGCGFNNISNFNRAFKKRMGMSPGEYRAMQKASIISETAGC